jgi:DNA-binding MarR family transcriptional regulator
MMIDERNMQVGNPADTLLGYRLRRASVAMMADLAASLQPVGMSPVQATILLMIEANPGCRQRDLCDALAIKRTNMAPHISALMGAGIIEREARDGRSHALYLTTDGQALTVRIAAIIANHEARFEEALPASEREALMAALRIIERTGRSHAASPEG